MHTLYIDKPMKGHNLMQAIARVNRVHGDKPGGLVVDYLGIASDLKEALSFYSDAGGKGDPTLLQEQAEKDLYTALQRFVPEANAQFDAGDYTASLQTLAVLRAPVDAFFDDVMVNAEQMDLRLNRQGLLKSLHLAMNRVADLSKLAA